MATASRAEQADFVTKHLLAVIAIMGISAQIKTNTFLPYVPYGNMFLHVTIKNHITVIPQNPIRKTDIEMSNCTLKDNV